MPQLTGAWTRFAADKIHDYAVAISHFSGANPNEILARAKELAAWEAIVISGLPGYTGQMLEVVKDLRAIKEERDAKESQAKTVQLRDVDEGEILHFPANDGAPGVEEVGSDPGG